MDASSAFYRPAETGAEACLRQGEILTNLVRLVLSLESLTKQQPENIKILHGFAVVLSQDCDLDQDFKARKGENKADKIIPSVLFAEVYTAEELFGLVKSSEIWKRIKQNKDERYHFLQKVEPAGDALKEGLPELGIDFKRFFTIPTDEVYFRIATEAKRRCILGSPYLEHLSSRFGFYLSRVALPEEHFSEPKQAKPPQLLPNNPG